MLMLLVISQNISNPSSLVKENDSSSRLIQALPRVNFLSFVRFIARARVENIMWSDTVIPVFIRTSMEKASAPIAISSLC